MTKSKEIIRKITQIELLLSEVKKDLGISEKTSFGAQKTNNPEGGGVNKHVANEGQESFMGPKGGILLLLSEGFFSIPRTREEVAAKLTEKDYHYQVVVIQTALRRLSTGKTAKFVVLEKDKVKSYVKRK